MDKRQPPSKLIADVERKLQEIQGKVVTASEQLGLARKIVAVGKPYWQRADEAIAGGESDEVLSSGYHVLLSFSEQVKSLDEQSAAFLDQAQEMAGSATILAHATASTASVSGSVISVDCEPMRQFRYSFDIHDDYSRKFSAIKPELGSNFQGIRSAYFGTTTQGLRQALFMARQTFDELFDSLVTDAEVREQRWWSPEDPQKPTVVTRRQRMRYAAEKHVVDPARRNVLLDAIDHMNSVYNQLQKLHSRDTLDEEKDRDVLFEMLALLRNWVDSLKIA